MYQLKLQLKPYEDGQVSESAFRAYVTRRGVHDTDYVVAEFDRSSGSIVLVSEKARLLEAIRDKLRKEYTSDPIINPESAPRRVIPRR